MPPHYTTSTLPRLRLMHAFFSLVFASWFMCIAFWNFLGGFLAYNPRHCAPVYVSRFRGSLFWAFNDPKFPLGPVRQLRHFSFSFWDQNVIKSKTRYAPTRAVTHNILHYIVYSCCPGAGCCLRNIRCYALFTSAGGGPDVGLCQDGRRARHLRRRHRMAAGLWRGRRRDRVPE